MKDTMRILIAYDGSVCARASLEELPRAGLPDNAQALILSVAEVWMPPGAEPGDPDEISDALRNVSAESRERAELEMDLASGLTSQAAELLRASHPGWTISTEATFGSVATRILDWSDRWNADLIIVGSQGRSALGRLILGSVSQRVATEARTSVRVARGHEVDQGSPTRIMAAVDGSIDSMAAVEQIIARHWPEGTQVRIVAAHHPMVPTAVGYLIPPIKTAIRESNEEEKQFLKETARKTADRITAAGLNADYVLRGGDPKRVLVDEAERWNADCLFVGARGLSRLERLLLGSVSTAVVARAHCSVEIVRKRIADEQGR